MATIAKSVNLPISASRAFELFTHPQKLGWIAPHANIVPQVGGAYELFFHEDQRIEDSTKGCEIIAFSQDSILAFSWRGPTQFANMAVMNQPGSQTFVNVTFSTAPDSISTDVHVVHGGFGSTGDWVAALKLYNDLWDNWLEKLAAAARRPILRFSPESLQIINVPSGQDPMIVAGTTVETQV